MNAKSGNKAADRAAELREHAEHAREALGETVQQLSDKLDVPARAKEGAQQATELASEKAQQVSKLTQEATAQVKDTATRTLNQAERKIDDLPEPVREPAQRTMAVVRQRPTLVVLTMVGLFVLWRLLSRRSHH